LFAVAVPSVATGVAVLRVRASEEGATATCVPHIVKVSQTLELSQVLAPQAAVQVSEAPAAPTVFFDVAASHATTRLSEVVVQVNAVPAKEPVTEVQGTAAMTNALPPIGQVIAHDTNPAAAV
jgi:hypothetical protein